MKTILYTAPSEIKNEIEILSKLLDNGVDYLYIRKPELDDFSLVGFVEKISERHWKQCISTSLIITKEFDLGGYHFTRDSIQKNEKYNAKILDWLNENNKISSVSAHSIEEIKKYNSIFTHIIVSPIFKSISKENHFKNWNFDELKLLLTDCHASHAKTKLFAVGGIDKSTIKNIKNSIFDGVGLLGAIWIEPENAIDNFEKIIQQIN